MRYLRALYAKVEVCLDFFVADLRCFGALKPPVDYQHAMNLATLFVELLIFKGTLCCNSTEFVIVSGDDGGRPA